MPFHSPGQDETVKLQFQFDEQISDMSRDESLKADVVYPQSPQENTFQLMAENEVK